MLSGHRVSHDEKRASFSSEEMQASMFTILKISCTAIRALGTEFAIVFHV